MALRHSLKALVKGFQRPFCADGVAEEHGDKQRQAGDRLEGAQALAQLRTDPDAEGEATCLAIRSSEARSAVGAAAMTSRVPGWSASKVN